MSRSASSPLQVLKESAAEVLCPGPVVDHPRSPVVGLSPRHSTECWVEKLPGVVVVFAFKAALEIWPQYPVFCCFNFSKEPLNSLDKMCWCILLGVKTKSDVIRSLRKQRARGMTTSHSHSTRPWNKSAGLRGARTFVRFHD